MQHPKSCFLQVFGFEEGCGGESQLLTAIRTLPEVRIADWHSRLHGICLELTESAALDPVIRRLNRLGYQATTRALCPCDGEGHHLT